MIRSIVPFWKRLPWTYALGKIQARHFLAPDLHKSHFPSGGSSVLHPLGFYYMDLSWRGFVPPPSPSPTQRGREEPVSTWVQYRELTEGEILLMHRNRQNMRYKYYFMVTEV